MNWKIFDISNPDTYPKKPGWYYITSKFNHPINYRPSVDGLKLIGMAQWTGPDLTITGGGGFHTLKSDIGRMILSDTITSDVIAYTEVELPEAITDEEILNQQAEIEAAYEAARIAAEEDDGDEYI